MYNLINRIFIETSVQFVWYFSAKLESGYILGLLVNHFCSKQFHKLITLSHSNLMV